jgi:hypothetical protein
MPPLVASIVIRVTVVHREKSPVEKSSAKIATGPFRTVIGAEVPLMALSFPGASTAWTAYVCVLPGASPPSTKLAEDAVPTGAGAPSRNTR